MNDYLQYTPRIRGFSLHLAFTSSELSSPAGKNKTKTEHGQACTFIFGDAIISHDHTPPQARFISH